MARAKTKLAKLWKYWGYVALAALPFAWLNTELGPVPIAVLSGVVVLYMLLQAPVWCGAENRDGSYCRRNSSGLLLGCSLRQHKWQKLKNAWWLAKTRHNTRGLWKDPAARVATVSAVIGLISLFGSPIKLWGN